MFKIESINFSEQPTTGAQDEIHGCIALSSDLRRWLPACAGMTYIILYFLVFWIEHRSPDFAPPYPGNT
jgi:hypothetical protein